MWRAVVMIPVEGALELAESGAWAPAAEVSAQGTFCIINSRQRAVAALGSKPCEVPYAVRVGVLVWLDPMWADLPKLPSDQEFASADY